MPLSYELVSQFAKQLTSESKKTSHESTVYGTVKADEYGNKYVKLDGSDQLTPLSADEQPSAESMSVNANDGERVSVLIKNHTATVVGNISSPAARTGDVEHLGDQITEIQKFDILIGEKVQANEGYIKQLQTDKATVGDLTAATARITELEATSITTDKLEAERAEIDDILATKLDVKVADVKYATIENLDAAKADIDDLNADYITFKEATGESITAQDASIKELETKKLSAEQADITYANISFSNINEAAIKKIFSDTGMIKDLIVGTGTITGELVGVTISGDLIKANTLMADKLVVRGSDGNYYKLSTDFSKLEGVTPVDEDSIHGSTIVANSITAEKINVNDLVAFGATIGGFKIDTNAIHSVVKDSANNTTRGIYMDNDGQMAIGDADNYMKYYYDEETEEYKLEISASNILFGASKKTIEDVVDELSNIEIGARNLIRNSKNLLFAGYYFEDHKNTAMLGVGKLGNVHLGQE